MNRALLLLHGTCSSGASLVSADSTGLLGRLSSLLCYLTALGVEGQIPGLQAMRPLVPSEPSKRHVTATEPFLARLQKPSLPADVQHAAPRRTQTCVVASNYIPERSTLSLQSILSEIGDPSLDKFFAVPYDLIVDTASMWAIDSAVDWTKDVSTVAKDDVLLFNTEGDSPANITPQLQSGVHHLNYFCNRSVREFLREKLEE